MGSLTHWGVCHTDKGDQAQTSLCKSWFRGTEKLSHPAPPGDQTQGRSPTLFHWATYPPPLTLPYPQINRSIQCLHFFYTSKYRWFVKHFLLHVDLCIVHIKWYILGKWNDCRSKGFWMQVNWWSIIALLVGVFVLLHVLRACRCCNNYFKRKLLSHVLYVCLFG